MILPPTVSVLTVGIGEKIGYNYGIGLPIGRVYAIPYIGYRVELCLAKYYHRISFGQNLSSRDNGLLLQDPVSKAQS